jgi:hypothetical protein
MSSTVLLNQAADKLFLSLIHLVEETDALNTTAYFVNFPLLRIGIELAERVLGEASAKIQTLGFACIGRLKTSLDRNQVPAFEVLDLICILALVGASEEERFDFEKIMTRVGLSRKWVGSISIRFHSAYPLPNAQLFSAGELMTVIERRET